MADSQSWNVNDVPDCSGRTVVITGANSGIGYEAARALARRHAKVILACRSLEKARAAASAICAGDSLAVEVMELDLASLKSIRAFAQSFHLRNQRLDVLCNNAGVMAIPYSRTVDGFEMQFGTNHLGHFALTGLLLDALMATPGSRVVTVSSGMHRVGSIRFDNLQWERGGYQKWLAYGRSKLANLLFAIELQRRAERSGKVLISAACNPGYAATNLQAAGPKMEGSRLMQSFWAFSNRYFAESAATGAWPTLYAATSPEVRGGDYIAPIYLGTARKSPHRARPSSAARDPETAARLWEISEQLTGVQYAI